MPFLDPNGPWLTVLIFAVLFLVIFRRPLALAGKAPGPVGPGAGLSGPVVLQRPGRRSLGVNAFNALTLGCWGAGVGAAAVAEEFLRGAPGVCLRSGGQSTGVSSCLLGGEAPLEMGCTPNRAGEAGTLG